MDSTSGFLQDAWVRPLRWHQTLAGSTFFAAEHWLRVTPSPNRILSLSLVAEFESPCECCSPLERMSDRDFGCQENQLPRRSARGARLNLGALTARHALVWGSAMRFDFLGSALPAALLFAFSASAVTIYVDVTAAIPSHPTSAGPRRRTSFRMRWTPPPTEIQRGSPTELTPQAARRFMAP